MGVVELYGKDEFGAFEMDDKQLTILRENSCLAIVVRPLADCSTWPEFWFPTGDFDLRIIFTLKQMKFACWAFSPTYGELASELFDDNAPKFLAFIHSNCCGCGQLKIVDGRLVRLVVFLSTSDLPI